MGLGSPSVVDVAPAAWIAAHSLWVWCGRHLFSWNFLMNGYVLVIVLTSILQTPDPRPAHVSIIHPQSHGYLRSRQQSSQSCSPMLASCESCTFCIVLVVYGRFDPMIITNFVHQNCPPCPL
ncbi:hypothetical protein GQ53DRAFT_545302 [Thozetella sp. PMI_491]|nr:hypothetical protein GQ53DRAFT_545302 [Thozetella sp. PMI_491]